MTIIDDRTPGLSLPLPHPDNDGADDVLRLRQAFIGIDLAIAPSTSAVITRNAEGQIESITEQLGTGERVTTLVRDEDGLQQVTITHAGVLYTITYQRDEDGHISGYVVAQESQP